MASTTQNFYVHERSARSQANRGQAAVIEALREAIVRGDFAAGQRLVEPDLCEQFDASRAQIRLALFELAKEGLVTHEPNRGSRVRLLTVTEAIHILEVRMAIESHFAGQAAKLATEEQLGALRDTIGRMRDHRQSGDYARYDAENEVLHQQILNICDNEAASQIVRSLRNQSARQQFRIHSRRGGPAESLAEHSAIVDAIVSRDSHAASEAMRSHLHRVMSTYASALEG